MRNGKWDELNELGMKIEIAETVLCKETRWTLSASLFERCMHGAMCPIANQGNMAT